MRLLVIAASISAALRLIRSMVFVPGFASMQKAPDVPVYRPFITIMDGIGTTANHAWNWVVLLTAVAAFSTGRLPRLLSYIILMCNIVDVIRFMLPSLENVVVGIIRVALFIIWSIRLVVILIRKPEEMLQA